MMTSKYKRVRINKNKWKDEHRIVMEKFLGRELKINECVHHKNGNTRDNRLQNLELMDLREHASFHSTGTTHKGILHKTHREKNNLFWCNKCKHYLPKEYFWKNKTRKYGLQGFCKDCHPN